MATHIRDAAKAPPRQGLLMPVRSSTGSPGPGEWLRTPRQFQQPESSVDPVGTKIRVVYDPENPQKIRPEAEVEGSLPIKNGLQIGIGFVLAALLIFAVAMMTPRKHDRQ